MYVFIWIAVGTTLWAKMVVTLRVKEGHGCVQVLPYDLH